MEFKTKNTQVESIDSKGNPNKFSGKSTAEDMRGWIIGKIGKFSKSNSLELRMLFEEVLKAYNKFHPQNLIEVEISPWKGKSSFEIIKRIDGLTIIKYQKPNKESEPKKITTEVNKRQLSCLIEAIKYNSFKESEIKTKDIAFQYCINMGIRKTPKGKDLFDGNFDDRYYGWRGFHNRITIMLRALDKLGFIEYSNGKTKLINKNLSIQTILT